MKSAKLNICSNKQCKQVWNIIFSSFFPYIGTKNNVMIEKNSTWYCIEELIENLYNDVNKLLYMRAHV